MQAQGRGNGKAQGFDAERVAERQTQQLTQQLELSEDQMTKVKAISLEYAKKQQDVRTSTENRAEVRPQIQALNKEKNAAIKTVLTDKQIEKWSAVQVQRRTKQSARKGRPQGKKSAKIEGARPDGSKVSPRPNRAPRKKPTAAESAARRTEKLKKDVNLTEEQTTQVEAIHLKYAEKKMDARTNRTETVNMMKELYTAENEEINAVLTEEQISKRDTLNAERKAKKETMKMERSMKREQN